MRTFQSAAMVSTFLAIVSLSGQEASAAKLCEIVSCADGCYSTLSKASDVPLEMNQTAESGGVCPVADINTATNGEYMGFMIPLALPPQPVALDCSQSAGGIVCEGWPQGDSITYSWSATGGILPDSGTGSANPVKGFDCPAGTQGAITVTARSPGGASNTLTLPVTCPSTP